jgi:hypothetical protein
MAGTRSSELANLQGVQFGDVDEINAENVSKPSAKKVLMKELNNDFATFKNMELGGKDKDRMTKAEKEQALRFKSMALRPSVRALMEEMDADKDGSINMEELIEMAYIMKKERERIEDMYETAEDWKKLAHCRLIMFITAAIVNVVLVISVIFGVSDNFAVLSVSKDGKLQKRGRLGDWLFGEEEDDENDKKDKKKKKANPASGTIATRTEKPVYEGYDMLFEEDGMGIYDDRESGVDMIDFFLEVSTGRRSFNGFTYQGSAKERQRYLMFKPIAMEAFRRTCKVKVGDKIYEDETCDVRVLFIDGHNAMVVENIAYWSYIDDEDGLEELQYKIAPLKSYHIYHPEGIIGNKIVDDPAKYGLKEFHEKKLKSYLRIIAQAQEAQSTAVVVQQSSTGFLITGTMDATLDLPEPCDEACQDTITDSVGTGIMTASGVTSDIAQVDVSMCPQGDTCTRRLNVKSFKKTMESVKFGRKLAATVFDITYSLALYTQENADAAVSTINAAINGGTFAEELTTAAVAAAADSGITITVSGVTATTVSASAAAPSSGAETTAADGQVSIDPCADLEDAEGNPDGCVEDVDDYKANSFTSGSTASKQNKKNSKDTDTGKGGTKHVTSGKTQGQQESQDAAKTAGVGAQCDETKAGYTPELCTQDGSGK